MIDMSVSISGRFVPPEFDMKRLHRELGEAQVTLISNRVESGKTLTGGTMPPSLRVLNAGGGGVTLKDTAEMIDQSMKPYTVTEQKAVIGFGGFNAKKAGWNHFGAKTRNGKWRPRPRPFFGFASGDKAALEEVASDAIDDAVRKAGR